MGGGAGERMEKQRGCTGEPEQPLLPRLQTLLGERHIRRRGTLGALDGIERDLVAFLQRLEAGRVDRGVVDEHVLGTVIGSDETKTLRIVEPLYCPHGRHLIYSCYVVVVVVMSRSRSGRAPKAP